MTPAQSAAFVVAAKRIAVPVVSCVRADIRFGHLTQNLSREGLLALVAVLAASADNVKLKAVTQAPGDQGLPPGDEEEALRAAHAEYVRLRRAGFDVPFEARVADGEYRAGVRRRKAEAARGAAA